MGYLDCFTGAALAQHPVDEAVDPPPFWIALLEGRRLGAQSAEPPTSHYSGSSTGGAVAILKSS